MNEIQLVYEIISEVWKIAKKFNCRQLSNDEWQQLINDGMAIRNKYRKNGPAIDFFCRDLFMAVNNYYERKNRL